ncbi:DUF6712 family protein [Tenacibaculum maritimum]|uniref:DUF6712 family protein n=1 Tax=Tenacibaculum maritimum TaxID=107401 RepID=UPI0038764D40
MITSRSFYKSLIKIPNAQDTAPNSKLLGNGNLLDFFIEEHEPEVLIDCFGYSLYEEFLSQFDENYKLKDNVDQKWKDLLNGKEYQLEGKKAKWRGLIFKEKDLDRSLIAYYVFCEFLNKDQSSYNGTGTQKEKTKNTTPVSSDPLYVASFRKFHKLTEFSNRNNGLRSLYDFIQDMNNANPNTYPNWCPERFENINTWGV